MSLGKKKARALLVVGIVLMVAGLAIFLIVPLYALASLVVGAGLVVVSSTAWSGRSGREVAHHHGHRGH